MGLDYTNGCVNFRDVGAYINLILDRFILPEGKLYRGGSIDYIKEASEIAHCNTIINLRKRADFEDFNLNYLHFSMVNNIEKYDTSQNEVKRWLNSVIKTFENPELPYPVLIHCLSGKDRTGIVVAALLLILGIDKATIIEEYLLSDGEVKTALITMSIEGMLPITDYFEGLDLALVKQNLLS
jgi:protein-tyrosine phosphatase